MKKFEFILQQESASFTYIDIYSCSSLSEIRKVYVIMKDKYPQFNYRIVRWSYNV